MNQRIRQLYDQAIVIEDGGDYVCGELDPVKFAQLIVQECMKVSNRSLSKYELPSDKIAEHFGVEEHENH
jgi:hypothetical protein